MAFSAMYYIENKQSRVAACCDLPGDSISLVRESGDIVIVSKIRCRCKASVVGNAGFSASYFSKTAEIRIFGISKIAEIRIFGKIICLIH